MTQTWECAEARPALGVYVLGAIDPAERGLVDAHLVTCRDCRHGVVSNERLRHELLLAVGRVSPDEERDAQILTLLRREGVCGTSAAGTDSEIGNAGSRKKEWWPQPDMCRIFTGLKGRSLKLAPGFLHMGLAMAAGFVITWAPLRWADAGSSALTAPLPARTARRSGNTDRGAMAARAHRAPTLAALLQENQETVRPPAGPISPRAVDPRQESRFPRRSSVGVKAKRLG